MTDEVFTTLATSTIAMSAYSLLAVAGEPVPLEVLYGATCKGHEHAIPVEEFARALEGLVQRGLASEVSANHYRANGPPGQPVRWRSCKGDGWEGWQVRGPNGRPINLSELLNSER